MAWSVVLFFDSLSERRIRELWARLRIPGSDAILYEDASRPHLSLSVLETQDGTLEERVAAVAARTGPFCLHFAALGHFHGSGVLYMSPRLSEPLDTLYHDMYASYGPLREQVWPLYSPGKWVPHSTVAMGLDPSGIRGTLRRARGLFIPFTARCVSLAVVKFRPVDITGEYPLTAVPADRPRDRSMV